MLAPVRGSRALVKVSIQDAFGLKCRVSGVDHCLDLKTRAWLFTRRICQYDQAVSNCSDVTVSEEKAKAAAEPRLISISPVYGHALF